jgi:non-ribosomal peptide synthetase component E (peptide arylation enzyme)
MNVLYALRRAKCFHGDRTAIFDGDRSLTYRAFYDPLQVPTSVDFVDALPKGGTGKLQKNVLRARYS